jgi:phosphate:Na+ symporter
MTDARRHLASRRMRALLARFTTSPLTGAVTGAATTAVIQSSSATMVTVIGFVGAGLLSFPQALGVIYGANIGTTMTGWIVALVGLKLKIGVIALPLLLASVLARTVLRGTAGQVALAIAGFALVFIGLDMMQEAAEGFEGWLTADRLPADTLAGRLWLVAAGAVITIVIQSSSAGVAAALVLVGSGAMGLEQAAAMVIGMNIGTTFTALLATLGGSRDMYRTALAHFTYNAVTAVFAFAVLGFVVPVLGGWFSDDAPTALVVFHTLFNVAGAALFLPVTPQFARLIARLVPAREASLTEALQPSLLRDPRAAMDAALASADEIAGALFSALGSALHPEARRAHLADTAARIEPALESLRDYLSQIQVQAEHADARARFSALLHMVDHLGRLNEQIAHEDRMAPLMHDAMLRRPAGVLGAAARRVGVHGAGMSADKMARISDRIAGRAARLRRSALLREHVGLLSVTGVFELTDSMRWLQRSAHNAARVLFYRDAATCETHNARPEAGRVNGRDTP